MPHVILVSPHFPPTNAPDHQRVRQSLPWWQENGWSAEVVAVDPDRIAAPQDPFLVSLLPRDIPVHTVQGLGLGWRRIPGLGTLGYRAMLAVYRKLVALLRRHENLYETVVYFSTTQFPVHIIIPGLKKKFPGLTVVMDYQDPWFNPWYGKNPHVIPPGGRIRFGLSSMLDRYFERRVLQHIDGITTVSAAYRHSLCERFPWLGKIPWLELPFGGAAADFEKIRKLDIQQQIFNPDDGNIHWVHVGRGGPDLEKSLRALCRALKNKQADDARLQNVRLHFIGTDYAEAGRARKTLEPVAMEEGMAEAFREYPLRVPYATALRCLLDAHAIVMPGSADPAYSASKLYPCILAHRPLLAIFHRDSLVHKVLAETGAGTGVAFGDEDGVDQIASQIAESWLTPALWKVVPATDWEKFRQYTDRGMTARLSGFLETLIKG